jgi:hypothetical protein
MALQAKITFKFLIQGNGRNETIVQQPLAPNPNYALATQGAASYNSPALFAQLVIDPGWNQIVDPATYLTPPMARSYFAMLYGSTTGQSYPPGTLTLAGATTDDGIGIAVGQPMFLALPAGVVGLYLYNPGATSFISSSGPCMMNSRACARVTGIFPALGVSPGLAAAVNEPTFDGLILMLDFATTGGSRHLEPHRCRQPHACHSCWQGAAGHPCCPCSAWRAGPSPCGALRCPGW